MSPNECTTFPPDGELALYCATNDTDPALSVNHIYGGNLVAVPTGCPYSGTHSFVYGNRVETAGRYPSPLRVGAVGEVCTMARTEIVRSGKCIAHFISGCFAGHSQIVLRTFPVDCHGRGGLPPSSDHISLVIRFGFGGRAGWLRRSTCPYVCVRPTLKHGSVQGMGRWVEGNESQSANRYLVNCTPYTEVMLQYKLIRA
jgi:hypothetical protein